LKRPSFDQLPNPNTQKNLARILDPHAWPIGVGQSQNRSGEAVIILIENMIGLARDFIYAVDVSGAQWMFFIHRKRLWTPVYLPRACINDAYGRIYFPQSLEERQLGRAIDFEIFEWRIHRIHMAGLPRQIEYHIAVFE